MSKSNISYLEIRNVVFRCLNAIKINDFFNSNSTSYRHLGV